MNSIAAYIPLSEKEKARKSLFNLLGCRGGTWTQVSEKLQITRRNRLSCRFVFGDYTGLATKYGTVLLHNPESGYEFAAGVREAWFIKALGGHVIGTEKGSRIYAYK